MLRITIRNPKLSEQIKTLSRESETVPSSWVAECLEAWIMEHRAMKPYQIPAYEYEAREEYDATIYHVD